MDYRQSLLEGLGKVIGIQGLTFTEDHACSLSFDDKMLITIEAPPDENTLYLHSPLCSVPLDMEKREELYATLLTGNFLGKATNNASFCLDPEFGDLLLYQSFDRKALDVPMLLKALQTFANTMEGWLAFTKNEGIESEPCEPEPKDLNAIKA